MNKVKEGEGDIDAGKSYSLIFTLCMYVYVYIFHIFIWEKNPGNDNRLTTSSKLGNTSRKHPSSLMMPLSKQSLIHLPIENENR